MSPTEKQLAHYNDTGFLVLEKFVDESPCDQLRARQPRALYGCLPDAEVCRKDSKN